MITHGEPHPGNLIRSSEGDWRLVDWDTVALALPERDLWMLDDTTSGSLELWESLTGRRVHRPTIELYRLAWALSDLAWCVERSPAEADADADAMLAGSGPQPYGALPA